MTSSVTALAPQVAPAERPLTVPSGSSPRSQQRTAEDFEAQMLGALLQPMFATLPSDGAFGGGSAEAQWRPMLVEQFGRAMAHAGGVGIGQAVLAEMQRLQAYSTQAAEPARDATS